MLVNDIDYWIVDIKDVDKDIYQAYTGKKNSNVLVNLTKLIGVVGPDKVCVRIPLIKGYNTTENQYQSMEYILEQIHGDVKIDFFEYVNKE